MSLGLGISKIAYVALLVLFAGVAWPAILLKWTQAENIHFEFWQTAPF